MPQTTTPAAFSASSSSSWLAAARTSNIHTNPDLIPWGRTGRLLRRDSMSSSTPIPPPPRIPMLPRLAEEGGGGGGGGGGDGGVAGISPSIIIIAVIVVVMLLASISIHYFIRSLCRHSSSPRSGSGAASSAPPLPLVVVRNAAAAAAAAAAADQGKELAAERERLISRLPLFTLASSLAALPRSSKDCAVCQSAFRDDDELRLLPACCHAFHSRCVDPWLRANPSCPLCRSSIALPHPPLGELLRVELGSVSSRRSTSSSAAVAAAPPDDGAAPVRAYPLPSLPNSDSEYLVEEGLQVVLKPPTAANPPAATPPADEANQQQLSAVERGQPSSSLTPTASFSSARSVARSSSRWSNRWSSRWSSGRWSSRYDAGNVTAAATAEWWWDMDGGTAPAERRREAEDGSAFYGFVRWLTGAY